MNPEIKQQWVAALRSGEYKQGRGYLKVNNTYCCLGVLCEVMGVESKVSVDASGEDMIVALFDGNLTYPSYDTTLSAGLEHSNPKVRYKGFDRSLADLNDELKLSFNEIADLIEDQL